MATPIYWNRYNKHHNYSIYRDKMIFIKKGEFVLSSAP